MFLNYITGDCFSHQAQVYVLVGWSLPISGTPPFYQISIIWLFAGSLESSGVPCWRVGVYRWRQFEDESS